MRNSILPITSLIALVSCCPMIARSEDAAPRKPLEAAYKEYDKAALKGMPGMQKWCEENLAVEFTLLFADGNIMKRKQYLDMMDRLVKTPSPNWRDVKAQKTRIKKLAMIGADAVALVEIATTFAPSEPRRPRVELETSYRETWTKAGETWKVKRSEEIEAKKPEAEKPVVNKPRQPNRPPGVRRPNTGYPNVPPHP